MEIDFREVEGIGVLCIEGELDALTAPELTKFFDTRVGDKYPNLVADLQELNYSSSAGIRVFLGLARSSRQNGGDLRLAAVQPAVDKVFKLSKFDRIIKIFPGVDDAINSYKDEYDR